MLVLTATPIRARSVLTDFGDMDISELAKSRPGGTDDPRAIPLFRVEEVEDAVGRALGEGKRAYSGVSSGR